MYILFDIFTGNHNFFFFFIVIHLKKKKWSFENSISNTKGGGSCSTPNPPRYWAHDGYSFANGMKLLHWNSYPKFCKQCRAKNLSLFWKFLGQTFDSFANVCMVKLCLFSLSDVLTPHYSAFAASTTLCTLHAISHNAQLTRLSSPVVTRNFRKRTR